MTDNGRGFVIGIDGSRLSVGDRTGTETYTAEIITHLAHLVHGVGIDRLKVYLRTPCVPDFLRDLPGAEAVPIPSARLWTHWRLSRETMSRPPDVLFVPAHVVPLSHPRTVVTIHDLGYLHCPECHPRGQRRVLDATTRWSAKAASKIIAISDATRNDLIGAYRVSPENIRVIPHGVNPATTVTPDDILKTRARLGIPEKYILTVGTVQPRKNLARLVEALGVLDEVGLPNRLIVVGKDGWMSSEVLHEIERSAWSDRVVRLGYVPQSDLDVLYAGAEAFALPSLYEGFGMPALDALAAGIPTAASDRSALPSVVGDAALLVNPRDSREIGHALVRLLTDVDLRSRLRERGPVRAAQFRWSETADATMQVLRAVAAR